MLKARTPKTKVLRKLNEDCINKNSGSNISHSINKIKDREMEITFTWVIIFLILLVVFLYFLFTSFLNNDKHSEVRNGTLVTDFKDISTGMGDVVTITGSSKDEENYSFEVHNNSKKSVKYRILLVDDLDMIELDGCSSILLDKNKIFISLNDSKKVTLASLYNVDNYVLVSSKLGPEKSKKYNLNITSDNKDNGHFHGKIILEKQ